MNRISYSLGETIYHPTHGMGEVQEFETKQLLGSEYSFVVLFFPREELRISMPANKLEDSVRKPLSPEHARSVLATPNDNLEPLHSSWKVRNRKIQERLSSGDPLEVLTVFRGLQALKEKKGSLNNSDRKHLDLSLDLLTEEFSAVLDESPERIRGRLEEAAPTADAA